MYSVIPVSIPSPPPEWSSFIIPIGSWLHGLIPAVSESYGIVVRLYALCILTGIIVALFITNRRLTKRGVEPWKIIDLTIWGVVGGLIGARLWHVFTHPGDFFGPGKDLIKILYIWEGGVAIFGTLLGGALGYWIACRLAGLRFLSVADAIVPGLLLAQVLGRFGNYFNQEIFGLPTDLPWGLQIDRPNPAIPTGIGPDVLFHPTFIYEGLWNLAGIAIIMLIENRVTFVKSTTFPGKFLPLWPEFTRRPQWQWGKVLGLYLIWYGIGRTWFESIRLDPLPTLFGVRLNVWGAVAAILLGLVIIIVQSRRHPGIEPSPYLSGKQWVDPAEVDSEDTYSDAEFGDDAPAESGSKESTVAATSGTPGKS
ncbi:prolipoprotein diacylglyceryl transferase [soil metagenome]